MTTRTGSATSDTEKTPAWHGVHHIALATPDLDATVRFYCGVLGMRLLLTRRAPDGTPHLFIDAGGGATFHFWQANVEIFSQPMAARGFIPGALQHLSLRLPDEAALEHLRARLHRAGVAVTDVVQQGAVRLCLFQDNNGTQLEAAYWLDDLTARPVDPGDDRLFADPDPVPAVRALLAGESLFPG